MNLSILLSQLDVFPKAKYMMEQHPTPGMIAAEIVQHIRPDNTIIADFGCGTGILGIGCLALGAKKVYFVDVDPDVFPIIEKNIQFIEKNTGKKVRKNAVFIHKNISQLTGKDIPRTQLIVQNPPFGSKIKSIDTVFLTKAMLLAPEVYTFHLYHTKAYIERIVKSGGFSVEHCWKFPFPLKNTMAYHTKSSSTIEVGCWHIKKTSHSD